MDMGMKNEYQKNYVLSKIEGNQSVGCQILKANVY